MELEDFVALVPGFDTMPTREKIKHFAWHLHTHRARPSFNNDHIRGCFRQLHMPVPDVSVYLPRMATGKPPDLLTDKSGYRLERSVRSALDSKFGLPQRTVIVGKLLSDLSGKVPDAVERSFLNEAMSCYRVGANRACIVMTWNLAFDHLLRWMLADAKRLADFNAALPRKYPKKPMLTITAQEHFEELKEFEVIEAAYTASLISKNLTEILREKLKRRNIAAHPSQVVVTQAQADDVVTDLVNNVVLALA
jgi:hypothetical protein